MPSDSKLKRLAQDFLDYLEIEKGRASNTVENYKFYLKRFFVWANIKDPAKISQDKVRNFRLWLNRQRDANGQPLKKNTQKISYQINYSNSFYYC